MPKCARGDSLKKRFFSKILVDDGCWRWKGTYDGRGYGSLKIRPNTIAAHRASYEIFYGKFNTRLSVCHSCDNPSCVKPTHLFLGTQSDNMRDCLSKNRGRQILTEDNVLAIRNSYVPYKVTRKSLAKKFGISIAMIDHIVYGQSWAWV